MKQRKNAALQWLWFSLAASIIAPALVFAYAAYSAYHDALELADERIERSLEVSAEQALRVFRTIEITLDSIDQITRGETDATTKESGAELSERLTQFAHAFPDISSIWVLDRNGDALLSSLFFPVPAAFNAPERSHLKAELAQGEETYIGRVVSIALTGAILFPVSKRRHDRSGTFNGYTLISVLPNAFENLYATLRGKSSASFALIREDGAVLARYPAAARPGIVLDEASGFGQLIKSSPEGGGYTTISNVDGLGRRFAVKKLVGLPLYVSSSMESSEIRSAWLRQVGGYLTIGAPALILVCLLIVLTARRTAAFYAEAELRETLEQEMRRSQRIEAVGQLTGGIAHDFNNLLTIIIGNLQMAIRRVPDEKPRAMLENAQRGALRAASLTKRLLAFSRKQALDPKPVDLNRLIRDLTDMLARTLGETISIDTMLAADLWQTQADITELESAVLNLALNARDAMPDGGTLTLETANTFLDEHFSVANDRVNATAYVSVSVRDTGTGMSPEVVDKAFEPFFTTKPPGMGTGLGLSQVYGFVKQSDGDVRINSAPGAGTTVTIYLPRLNAFGEPTAEDQAIEGPPRGLGRRVLVTEDDEGVRNFVSETLIELGYEVMQAQDGDAALSALATCQVDLLLTDIVMPGMNGRALAEEAQRRQPGLKVLYMTGYSRDAIVHQGRLDPGVSLIQKPFTQNALAQRVGSTLKAI